MPKSIIWLGPAQLHLVKGKTYQENPRAMIKGLGKYEGCSKTVASECQGNVPRTDLACKAVSAEMYSIFKSQVRDMLV